MVVYNVPTSLSDHDFMDELYEINLSEEITRENFDEEVKLKFKTGPKDKRVVNNVIEVSPRLWYMFTKKERVYIDFQALRVKDFSRVQRCYTCHDLGHSAKRCKRDAAVCYRCAKPGHMQKDCKNAEEGCIPCMYRRRTCNKAGGPECPTHKQLLEKMIANTDYDYRNYVN